jgi:RimJ/RimL family protein N-acetyltransferase
MLAGGTPITLRHIRPEDESALTALYERLSPQTAYQPFFTVMRRLPPDWAHILANVDYDRRMAIAALGPRGGELIGVARYVYDERAQEAEIAIVIEDRWQGRGLGTRLLGEPIGYAEARGIRRFRAYVLADNLRIFKLIRRVTTILERKLGSGWCPCSWRRSSLARLPTNRRAALGRARPILQDREPERERRALVREGMDVDRSQVALDDAVAHRKPQACSRWLGRVEGLEEVGEMRRGDSGSGILHDQMQVARVLGVASRLDRDLAAARQGFSRVGQKIQQDLLERVGVAQDRGERRIERRRDADVFRAHGLADEQKCLVDHPVQVDRTPLPGGLAREGSQRLGHAGDAHDVAVDHPEVFEKLGRDRLVFGLAEHQLDP